MDTIDPLLSFELPSEGDRIRIWYRSTYSDSAVPRTVHGTVTETNPGKWMTTVYFDGDNAENDQGDKYEILRTGNRGWKLLKAAPHDTCIYGQSYRRVSTYVSAIAVGPGPALPPSPYCSRPITDGR